MAHVTTSFGLVVVDLLAADPRAMSRYMGAAGWEKFCHSHHACARKSQTLAVVAPRSA
jgi:hypothetical protein